MAESTAERTAQAILEKAVELSELLNEAVPDTPHYWRPWYLEGQEFPMDVDDFQWLTSKLSVLIGNLTEILEGEDED